MDTDNMNDVEAKIDYHFEERDILRQALTAAGAEQGNHDGNRRLALMGQAVMQLLISETGYEKSTSRGGK